MKINKTQLSASDLEYIQSILDRAPNKIELAFISELLKAENHTEYHATVSRFDEKANRKLDNRVTGNDQFDIIVASGVTICSKQNEVLVHNDQSIRKQVIKGSDLIINLFRSHLESGKNFKKTAYHISNRQKIIKKLSSGSIYSSACVNQFYKNNINYSFTLGTAKKSSNSGEIRDGSIIYQVFTGSSNVSPNKESKILKLGKWLNDQIDVERVDIVSESGILAKLVNILQESKFGAEITLQETARKTLNQLGKSKSDSLLLFINPRLATSISRQCNVLNIKSNEIGKISSSQEIKFNFTDRDPVVMPYAIINRIVNKKNTIHLTNEIKYTQTKNVSIKSPKNYNTIFIKLLSKRAASSENCHIQLDKNALEKLANIPLSIDLKDLDHRLILSHSDNFQYHRYDPRTGGHVAIANAVRMLACSGAKPLNLIINNIFPSKVDIETIERGQELLQGQEEAVSMLNIPIGDRTITCFEDLFDQNIFAMGIIDNDKQINSKVKQAGDFISILGSHRGELGGSLFNDEILKKDFGVLPKVDLSMENRIIDVLGQGSQTNLIKSAANVSRGGLALALAQMLDQDNPEFGLRIYISRKLLNEELLFGETQGLVLIALGENDLMEFERICMIAGVPSTTIGRVTSDGHFIFNDLIKVTSKRIHSVLEYN